eukprot:TRINITY_DN60686_c0_g1_i1.p1 TRINITY_DN60686_c0_g1~~TRINITY_DN60686_c0_g1_i1.p1  ORF type:complete len:488 (-),score=70.20 TRINITY_DN60686_c0_g1_i1:46-1467(-)
MQCSTMFSQIEFSAAHSQSSETGSISVSGSQLDRSSEAVRKYLERLSAEADRLEEMVRELKAEAAPCATQAEEILQLNVGGDTSFVLSRDHFSFIPDSLLHALLSGSWHSITTFDADGRIFLDMDPLQFRAILDWTFEVSQSMERPEFVSLLEDRVPEPHCWGIHSLMKLLGLGNESACFSKHCPKKLDPEDGQALSLEEVLAKYCQEFTKEEIRDYWQHNMIRPSDACLDMRSPRHETGAHVHVSELHLDLIAGDSDGDLNELSSLLADHIRAAHTQGLRLKGRQKNAKKELEQLEAQKMGILLLGGGTSHPPESTDPAGTQIVHFNVAGRLMATTRATLTYVKNSMLARWFGGDWTLQPCEFIGDAVRIEQESETFASILQVLRFHRMFGRGSLPGGLPCRKARLPALRHALSYFQLELVKSPSKGHGKQMMPHLAHSLGDPRPRESDNSEGDQSTSNSVARWEVAVEVAL